jgi:tetratricopeptide (TPR) repeat protein
LYTSHLRLYGRFEEAIVVYESALVDFDAHQIPLHHPFLLNATSQLGSLYISVGRVHEAHCCFERVLAEYDKSNLTAGNSAVSFITINTLATLLKKQVLDSLPFSILASAILISK